MQLQFKIISLLILIQCLNNIVLSNPDNIVCSVWGQDNSLTFTPGSIKYYTMSETQAAIVENQIINSKSIINVTSGSLGFQAGYLTDINNPDSWVKATSVTVISPNQQQNLNNQFNIPLGSYASLKVSNPYQVSAVAQFIKVDSICFGSSSTGTTTGGTYASVTTTSSSSVSVTSSTASVTVDTGAKLTGGAKAGIAIVVILILVGFGILAYIFIYKRRHHSYNSIH